MPKIANCLTISSLILLSTGVGYLFSTPVNAQLQPPVNGQVQPPVIPLDPNPSSPRTLEPPVNSIPTTQDQRFANIVFTFNSLYEYNNCLDQLLLAYEGRTEQLQRTQQVQGENVCAQQVNSTFGTNLSRDVMLQLINLANFRATSLLSRKLFPTYGIRRRVAMELGYVYELDRNNQEIVNYAASANTQP